MASSSPGNSRRRGADSKKSLEVVKTPDQPLVASPSGKPIVNHRPHEEQLQGSSNGRLSCIVIQRPVNQSAASNNPDGKSETFLTIGDAVRMEPTFAVMKAQFEADRKVYKFEKIDLHILISF